MKKTLALLVSVCMLLPCLSLASFAADQAPDLRIAIASDLHYNQPRTELEHDIDDPVYWYANRRAAMEDESGFIIDAFLDACAAQDYDYVLIAGDLADNGRRLPQEHQDVAKKLAAFEEKTGKQVFVIDGNHDIAKAPETDMAFFKQTYAEFGYDRALTISDSDCSYTADLGEKYRLIALDSCNYNKSTEDGMTAEKLAFVRREAAKAKADGRWPIVMMHHNLLDHMPMQRIVSHNFIVRFHRTTAQLFADWGVRIVLSGHEHCSDVSVFTSAAGNKIYDFANTSLTMYPLAYREMSFSDNTIRYEDIRLKKIDTDVLQKTVDGYTSTQIDLMNADLDAYAKGFLKAGVQYRLWLGMTMEKMGISESDFYYDAANALISRLNALLAMPLYGSDSLCTLAAEYGIQLPQTDFANGWDLATELVSWHYSGGEHFALDSAEVTLFLRALNLILHDDLAQFNDKILLKGANALLSKFGTEDLAQTLTKFGARTFGAVTAGETFLLALISPFLYEFAFDADGVQDNAGEIEGYAVQNRAANIADNIRSFFSRIWIYLENLALIVLRGLRVR